MRLLLSSLIISIFISCGTRDDGRIPLSDEEFKIYYQVIDSLYYQEEIKGKTGQKEPRYLAHNYVLIDSTDSDITDVTAESFAANGITSAELVNNFKMANAYRYSLAEYSKNPGNLKLISLENYRSYYAKTRHINDGGMSGFIEFSKDYPHSYGTSVFQVTRVGFSSDNKYAIVGTMHLRGINMGYDYTFLEKAGERWMIREIINH